jgi:hypothetical protein
VPEPGLAISLRLLFDGGTKVAFPLMVLWTFVPTLDSSAQVRWRENIILSCGLFPCQRPRALVYCPCYRLPTDKLVVWALTLHEMLRLYQLPLSMDALLADLHPTSPLPYETLAPPGLFTSVLRQLWGVVRGGSALEEERRVEEVVGIITGEEEVDHLQLEGLTHRQNLGAPLLLQRRTSHQLKE